MIGPLNVSFVPINGDSLNGRAENMATDCSSQQAQHVPGCHQAFTTSFNLKGHSKALRFTVCLCPGPKLLFLSHFFSLPANAMWPDIGLRWSPCYISALQPTNTFINSRGFCLNMVSGTADMCTCTSCTRQKEKKQWTAEQRVGKYSSFHHSKCSLCFNAQKTIDLKKKYIH